uniref:Sulfide:quinone oxidoreductase, mitochondrial n=1 Tax=Globodera pallida TaxID=36090 RepID=A0A183CBY2_GLOPA
MNSGPLLQPGLTLAAAGLMNFEQLHRDESSVLPHGVNWFQNSVQRLLPESNELLLDNGQAISYDFLVLALGIELRYDYIEGLSSGTESVLISPSISSIYFPEGAKKTLEELNKFPSGGVALFTYPAYPIKCAGAPLKICFLAEEIFRRRGIRSNSFVRFCTSNSRVFGVPKYAESLERVIKERGIEPYLQHNLVKVDAERRHAVFEVLNEKGKGTGERRTLEYSFLHIGPPCSPAKALIEHAQKQNANALQLTDPQGWVKVDPRTLQSPAFPNVFAIGDCANTPNAKTAAAVSSQLKALAKNLKNVMDNKAPIAEYDGYASCPLVVDRRHVVLAEFSPNGPMETFPYDQSRPTMFAYLMKRYVMPPLYWMFLLKGYWEGPATLRKIFGIFARKSNAK